VLKLIKPEKVDKPKKPNVFAGISTVPTWQLVMELIVKIAAIITVLDYATKVFAG
jgi:hypothetical protein